MRYTLKRDDMPLLLQWIKKSDKTKRVGFFGRGYRNRTYTKGVRGPCATTTPSPSDEGIIIHIGSNDKPQRLYAKKILKNVNKT